MYFREAGLLSIKSTTVTSGTIKSKRSRSAYDPGYDQHLTDYGIYTTYGLQKPDLEEVRAAMAV